MFTDPGRWARANSPAGPFLLTAGVAKQVLGVPCPVSRKMPNLIYQVEAMSEGGPYDKNVRRARSYCYGLRAITISSGEAAVGAVCSQSP